MIGGPLPRHHHHMGRIEAASSRSVAKDLDYLIRVALHWLALPPGMQRRDPLLIGPYVRGASAKLRRTLQQAIRVHRKAEFAADSVYDNLSEMLRAEKADLWPDGLTMGLVDELKIHQDYLPADARQPESSTFSRGEVDPSNVASATEPPPTEDVAGASKSPTNKNAQESADLDCIEASARLMNSPKGVQLLRFLSRQPERKASFDRIAMELEKAPALSVVKRRGTIRQRCNRTRTMLEELGGPVWLLIVDNAVELHIGPSPPQRATSV